MSAFVCWSWFSYTEEAFIQSVSKRIVRRLYIGLIRPLLKYASMNRADSLSLDTLQLSVACAVLQCKRDSVLNQQLSTIGAEMANS